MRPESHSSSFPLLARVVVVLVTCLGGSIATVRVAHADHRPDHTSTTTSSTSRPATTSTTVVATTTTTVATTTTTQAATTTTVGTTATTTAPDTSTTISQSAAATTTSTAPGAAKAAAGTTMPGPKVTEATPTTSVALSTPAPTAAPAGPRPAPPAGAPPTAPTGEDAAASGTHTTPASLAIATRDRPGSGATPLVATILLAIVVMAACFAIQHNLGWGWWPRVAGIAGSGMNVVAQHFVATDTVAATGSRTDPSAARIGGRLVALVGVAARASAEFGGGDRHETLGDITGWVRAAGIGDGIEGIEEAILSSVPGAIDDADLALGTWQIEGAVVLAWVLGLLDELPPHDEAMDPALLSTMLGFPDAEQTRAILRSAGRRRPEQVDDEADRHYSIYWRLQEFAATGETLDLEKFIHGRPSGPLHFERVPLVDGDMAVGGRPIALADPELHDIVRSITTERLRALEWLTRGGPYAAVDDTVDLR